MLDCERATHSRTWVMLAWTWNIGDSKDTTKATPIQEEQRWSWTEGAAVPCDASVASSVLRLGSLNCGFLVFLCTFEFVWQNQSCWPNTLNLVFQVPKWTMSSRGREHSRGNACSQPRFVSRTCLIKFGGTASCHSLLSDLVFCGLGLNIEAIMAVYLIKSGWFENGLSNPTHESHKIIGWHVKLKILQPNTLWGLAGLLISASKFLIISRWSHAKSPPTLLVPNEVSQAKLICRQAMKNCFSLLDLFRDWMRVEYSKTGVIRLCCNFWRTGYWGQKCFYVLCLRVWWTENASWNRLHVSVYQSSSHKRSEFVIPVW